MARDIIQNQRKQTIRERKTKNHAGLYKDYGKQIKGASVRNYA